MNEYMLCVSLYNDIASVIFGLYENKDESLPYSLFVINFNNDKIHIFSSENHITNNLPTIPYKEWKKNNFSITNEFLKESDLNHKLFVTSKQSSKNNQIYDDSFFNNMLGKSNIKLNFSINNSIYILLYQDILFEKNIPTLMMDACEKVFIKWRDFLKFRIPITNINVNELIESLDCFKDVVHLFKTVTKISSLFYEKNHSNGSIVVMRDNRESPLIEFNKKNTNNENLTFSREHVKQLRKLLETSKNGLSLLVYNDRVYGIDKPSPVRAEYIFKLAGHLEWHVLDCRENEKVTQMLRYKHGEYYLPIDKEIRDWYIRVKIKDENLRKTFNSLLQDEFMKVFKHGALLIITNEAKKEVNRLCKKKRGLHIEPINLLSNKEIACALCAIDGALFLDKDGFCHGIGIILDGEANVDGTPARGSRYNSTKTYIFQCATKKRIIEAYAIIISTDGYLDIITTHDEDFKIKK